MLGERRAEGQLLELPVPGAEFREHVEEDVGHRYPCGQGEVAARVPPLPRQQAGSQEVDRGQQEGCSQDFGRGEV
jgi:hypothetical protein